MTTIPGEVGSGCNGNQGWRARTYIDQPDADIDGSLEDLPATMDDENRWNFYKENIKLDSKHIKRYILPLLQ